MALGFIARAFLTYRATARCRYLAQLQAHAAICPISDFDRCPRCYLLAKKLRGAINAVGMLLQAGDTIVPMPCDDELDLEND